MAVIHLRPWKCPVLGRRSLAEWGQVAVLLASGYSALALYAGRSASRCKIITVNSAEVSR